MYFDLLPFHLRTLSAICANISAGFILLAIAARDAWVLTGNVIFVILFLLVTFKLEAMLEEL